MVQSGFPGPRERFSSPSPQVFRRGFRTFRFVPFSPLPPGARGRDGSRLGPVSQPRAPLAWKLRTLVIFASRGRGDSAAFRGFLGRFLWEGFTQTNLLADTLCFPLGTRVIFRAAPTGRCGILPVCCRFLKEGEEGRGVVGGGRRLPPLF